MRGQTQYLVQQRSYIERVAAPPRVEPVHFWDTETDDTTCIHSFQRRTLGYGGVRTKAERRHSFGTCFRSSNGGSGGTSWGVDRARRARRAVHRPVERRMAKSWNQDQDRGRFLLSKGKAAQCQTSTTHSSAGSYFLVYDLDLLWHVIMTVLHSPMSHRRPRQLLLNYHKAQVKRVLKHARAELVKGVRTLRYNDLVMEG